MALTESRLRQIVREEARRVMKEAPGGRFGGWGSKEDEFGDDDAARDHFDRDFDDDSDDEYDAIKDYAAVTGRDKMDVYHDRMSGRLGRRRY
jgi:hypothetical protein